MVKILLAAALCACFSAVQSQVVINTNTCGSTKGCWSSATGCTQSTCQWLVTYALDSTGQKVVFEMSGQPANNASSNVYVAVALSTNGSMGEYYSVACYNDNGQWAVGNGNTNTNNFIFNSNNLLGSSISYNSAGIISCTFTRSRASTGFSDDLTVANAAFYLMFFTGTLTPGAPPTMNYSPSMAWSSMTLPQPNAAFNLVQYPLQTSTASAATYNPSSFPASNISTAGCYTSMGCWMSSPGCTWQNCSYLATWTPNAGANYATVQVSAIITATAYTPWVSVAFSDDNLMGNDYTIGCWWNGSTVIVQDGRTFRTPIRGHRFNSPINVGVTPIGGWYNPAYSTIGCSFNVMLNNANSTYAKNLTGGNAHYLFVALGILTTANVGFFQHVNVYRSTAPVDITVVSNVASGGGVIYWFSKVHASLMIFAWMVSIPIGSLVARHYRITLAIKSTAGQKVWFQLHRSLQIIGTMATVTSFVVIFTYTGGWSPLFLSPAYTHPIIGVVVTGLCLLNFFIGLGYPGNAARNEQRGRVFRFFHAVFGIGSLLLSFINIMIAMLMTEMPLPIWLIAFPISFLLVHLIATVALHGHEARHKSIKSHSHNGDGASKHNRRSLDTEFTTNNGPSESQQNAENQANAEPSSDHAAKHSSMINNKYRKNVLYAYAVIVTCIAAAFIAVLVVLF